MTISISKRTANEWIVNVNSRNEQMLKEMRSDGMVDVAVLSTNLTWSLLRSFTELGDDKTERIQITEQVAKGMSHAIQQWLLHCDPPSFEPSCEKVH